MTADARMAENDSKARRTYVGIAVVAAGFLVAFLSPPLYPLEFNELRLQIGLILIAVGGWLIQNRLITGVFIGVALTFEVLFLITWL